ncbi:hypothetical protein G6F68_019765 [Rhizopus microsporus]|nr:hypothetical protein G6F68_019765 [Rhizopus microsporus]
MGGRAASARIRGGPPPVRRPVRGALRRDPRVGRTPVPAPRDRLGAGALFRNHLIPSNCLHRATMTQELITISPIDGREVVRRAYASEAQIAQALAQAQSAQAAWQALGVGERGRIVSAAVDRFVAAKDEIARAITIQMGRP